MRVAAGAATEDYTYTADGLRRRAITAEGTTQFVWDGQNLLAELDDAGATTSQSTDFPGHWGGLSSRRAGDATTFLTHDLSANTRHETTAAGTVAAAPVYTAFGTELAAPTTPAGFGGQLGYHRDQPDRLYVRARHYRPGRGRWISRDPLFRILRDRTMQLYGVGNPVAETDPSGLLRPSEFGAWSEERKAKWLAGFRRRYGKLVCEAARRHCVPGELVIGMIVNEQIDYTRAERFAESLGYGDSVGLAQITIGTAVHYGLTDCKLSDYKDKEVTFRGDVYVVTAKDQYLQCVRAELITDPGNIEATARLVATYLDGLCERARNRDRGVQPMLSDSFLTMAASCKTADFCCREEAAKRGDCAKAGERIAKLNTRSCLLAAMAVVWNNGIKTAENPDILNTAKNAWNHGSNADTFISDRLDGFCA